MSLWHNILVGILLLVTAAAILGVLCAALLQVRFQGAWFGMWTGDLAIPHEQSLRIEYGFPGFMHTWKTTGQAPDAPDPARDTFEDVTSAEPLRTERHAKKGLGGEPGAAAEATASRPEAAAPGASAPRRPRPRPRQHRRRGAGDRHRHRRALFRFATDGTAWRLASGYFMRVAVRAFRLPGLHVELAVGHPDPAWLGRFAGHWYAFSPLLPTSRAFMHFRFQDRQPSFGVRARGGFSLFAFLWFLALNVLTFPWIRLGQRAWMIWRHGTLAGWRAWTYRKIQTL